VKVYEGTNVRNVALVGHADAGKTSLAAALLYTAGATPQLGRVDNGTAPTEYDEEEIARAMSISNSIGFAEWNNKTKINLIDTPGFNMFVHARRGIRDRGGGRRERRGSLHRKDMAVCGRI
jgi:elongation factor G